MASLLAGPFAAAAKSPAKKLPAKANVARAAKAKPSGYRDRKIEQTPLTVSTATTTPKTQEKKPSSGGLGIGRTIFGMMLVIGLIYLVRKVLLFLRPDVAKGLRQSKGIDVTASRSLPGGAMLHVVQIGERAILVGVHGNAVAKLDDLDAEDLAYIISADALPEGKVRSFGDALRKSLSSPRQLDEARRQAKTGGGKSFIQQLKDKTAR